MTFLSVPWKETDHGYPSSVQLGDGTIVTAYYFGGRKGEEKYGGRADLPGFQPWSAMASPLSHGRHALPAGGLGEGRQGLVITDASCDRIDRAAMKSV